MDFVASRWRGWPDRCARLSAQRGRAGHDADAERPARNVYRQAWVYRSFTSSPKAGDSLAKLALGLNELDLTEQGGRIVGKRIGQGVDYDLRRRGALRRKAGRAIIRLHGQATISGKLYNYDYFGYPDPLLGRSRGDAAGHHHGNGASQRSHKSIQRPAHRPRSPQPASRTALKFRIPRRQARRVCERRAVLQPEATRRWPMFELQILLQRRRKIIARLMLVALFGTAATSPSCPAPTREHRPSPPPTSRCFHLTQWRDRASASSTCPIPRGNDQSASGVSAPAGRERRKSIVGQGQDLLLRDRGGRAADRQVDAAARARWR